MSKKGSLVTQLTNPASLPTVTPIFSLSASFTTPATVVRYLDNCSYQINVNTTDSTGTFQVQVSNDYYVDEANGNKIQNPGNWSALTLTGAQNSGVPTVAAANDTIGISLNQLPYYAVRLAYIANNPGTGTAQVYITDKSLG